MEYAIRNMSYQEFDKRRKDSEVAFLPMGACEVYGEHLPLGSDGIVAQYVAEEMARRVNGVMLPLIPVGCSKPLYGFPGTLAVQNRTLYNYAKDLIEGAIHWGYKKIFVCQGHLTNVAVVDDLVFDLKEVYPDVQFAQIDLWRFFKNNSFDVSEDKYSSQVGHACEVGTSVLKYVADDLVKPCADQPNLAVADMMSYGEINRYFGFDEVSANGTLGNPSKATAEKGKILMDRLLDRIEGFVKDWDKIMSTGYKR